MCIAVFLWRSHPLYPLVLLLNRDEYHSRPTNPLAWWDGEEDVLGGRDGLAGGTWLCCGRDGKLAFLTNVRELSSLPLAKSRGDLPVRFLQSQKSPVEFGEEVMKETDHFNGFNLVLVDLCSEIMAYVTNRPKGDEKFVTEVSPGIHVLTNASLDTPWPKAQRLWENFKELLNKYGDDELPAKVMADELMTNTTKDDMSVLPQIFPPEREYQLSSIFVDGLTPLGRYGTRSTSAVTARPNGEVSFYEKYFDSETALWKDHTITFRITSRKQPMDGEKDGVNDEESV